MYSCNKYVNDYNKDIINISITFIADLDAKSWSCIRIITPVHADNSMQEKKNQRQPWFFFFLDINKENSYNIK
jgi:hypothetical protein